MRDMRLLSRANKIRKERGYWSLIWRTYMSIMDRLKKRVRSQEKEYVRKDIGREAYGFCANLAGKQAKMLGLSKVSLIEFGVAGGNGLVNLERYASALEREHGIKYEIYGFDTGEGMPPPESYKDSPYHWREGDFDMDVELLKAKLNKSTLVIGDVEDTILHFVSEYNPAPIGAIYVDLDYYSPTKNALEILNKKGEYILPRIGMYFDDVTGGGGLRMTIPHIGEIRAIREFNEENSQGKVGKLQFSKSISEEISPRKQYAYHRFNHDMYDNHINKKDRQNPLSISS